jgi:hypothetical protein
MSTGGKGPLSYDTCAIAFWGKLKSGTLRTTDAEDLKLAKTITEKWRAPKPKNKHLIGIAKLVLDGARINVIQEEIDK